ncbi:MAG: SUMF1/EgtB/PvdO family nonheme iron enzyme [Chitinophagales bacterium]
MQNLLNQIGGDYGKSQLKHLLAPIFVTNPKQQQLFYQAFDNYFDQFETVPLDNPNLTSKPLPKPPPLTDILPKKRNYWLLGILVFLLGLSFIWMTQREELDRWREEYTGRLKEIISIDQQYNTDSTAIGQNPPKPPENPNAQRTNLEGSGKISLPLKPAIEENIDYLIAEWYQRLGWWLKLSKWALLLGIFIAFVVYQLYRRNKKQALLQRERNQAPPDYWNPLQVADTPKKLYDSAVFYQTAKEMRVRVKGDTQVLNVDKTIAATLESGGYPSFEFDDTSRPVEYLVLIEEQTPKDHQARFFERLTTELAQQDVYIERYFYQNDPRHCWKIEYQIETNLYDLAMRFPNHRLLVMGSGDAFLDAVSEDVLRWTQQFSAWQTRFLVTPKPIDDWGFVEIQLCTIFHILPANISALEKMDDTLLHPEQYPLKYWLSQPSNEFASISEPIEVGKLKEYFTPKTYQLLCACAVYPELHWDFTLHLAKKMSAIEVATATNGVVTAMSKKPLLQPANLLQLARLVWFRQGFIPDVERQLLIADLQPEYEALVRKAIVDLLKENPPPTNSYAYDEYAMNLAVNEWELAEDAAAKKAHQEELAELMDRERLLQFVRVKYQRSVQKIKDAFAMPESLKENLFKGGIPILGFKNYVSGAIVLLSLAFLGWIIEVPEGEHLAEFEGEYYYLATKRDTARFYHYKAQFNEDPIKKQALLDTSLAVDTMYAKAHYNLALTYYDALVGDESVADSQLIQKAVDGFLKTVATYDILEEKYLEGERETIKEIQFAPNDTTFATIEDDNVVRLRNLKGTVLSECIGHTEKIMSVNFSDVEPWVITASLDGTVRIWSLDGAEIYRYAQPSQYYRYACFVPNNRQILVSYVTDAGQIYKDEGTTSILDLSTEIMIGGEDLKIMGTQEISQLNYHIYNPNFSKDGQQILYSYLNQTIQQNIYSGEIIQTIDHNAPAIASFFVLDDLLQVTISEDGELTVHEQKGQMKMVQLDIKPYSASISENGRYLFVRDEGTGKIGIWNIKLTWNGIENWGLVKSALTPKPTFISQTTSNSPAIASEKEAVVRYEFPKLNEFAGNLSNGRLPIAYSPSGKYILSSFQKTMYVSKADLQSVAYSLYNMGVIQYEKKEYQKAVSFFSQAHVSSPQDASILYARAVSQLYMDSLEAGLKDIAAVLDLDKEYFQFNLAILPLLQDLYLKTGGTLQEEVAKTLQELGIDMEKLQQIAEQQRLKQLLGEQWKGVYLTSSKFSNDKKWRSFAKLVIAADGTVRLGNDTIQNMVYLPDEKLGIDVLQWSSEKGNKSSASLEFRRSVYGTYKKEEWSFNKTITNLFTNFFDLQNQIIEQQFATLEGAEVQGLMTLEEETDRQVRGWTFDTTPAILQTYYKEDVPAPNFNKDDYAYVSEPNQYGLLRVQGESGLWGIINLKGQILLPLYYEGIGIFSEGLAGVQKNEKIGFINPEGEVVIKPQFDEVTLFKDGIATVKVDGRTFEIDQKGNKINELVQQTNADSKLNETELSDIGQYEQMKVTQQDTRQQLLAPAGMVYVEGGAFVMGSNEGEADERPAHRENVGDFYMEKYEVTNAQFVNFLKEYGSDKVKSGTYSGQPLFEDVEGVRDRGFLKSEGKVAQVIVKGLENQPVRYVTWYGANEYARFYGKRLPTEAEWEYAARGGQNGSNYVYAGSNDAGQVAWYRDNANGRVYVVGKKRANELGIFDMSGNVAEWCQDWYAANAYGNSTASVTQQKVIRGGAYDSGVNELEVTDRASNLPNERVGFVGFRCVRDVKGGLNY